MPIETLHLKDFRNYAELDLSWHPGVNLVVGPNAQGKTNLLEALYLLSTGRLLRGLKDAEAIRSGAQTAVVRGVLAESGTELKVVLEAGVRKRAYLNHASLPRTSDLLGRLPTVTFSNDDLEIVRGDAGERRSFWDSELSQIFPAYLRAFAGYKRALEQRNALLRQSEAFPLSGEVFEPWEAQMALHGQSMREFRKRFLEELQAFAAPIHAEMAKGETLTLELAQKDEHDLQRAFSELRDADLRRGTTTIGPHRDDFVIRVDGKEARLYGSQGQQRTAAIALKLATMQVIHNTLQVPPLVLLDDILSELDAYRREHLLLWVGQTQAQTVLTCTEAEQAGQNIVQTAAIYRIRAGTVTTA